MKKTRFIKAGRFVAALLALCLTVGLCSGTVSAKDRRNVKVAFFPMGGIPRKG